MSLTEEPSDENNQMQEDDELDPEDINSKGVQVKEFLKTSQTEKRTFSPLALLKEDFNQFKEEVRKVFKDKEAGGRTIQPVEKQISPLTLLKEDFNHLKEDLSSVFRVGLSKEQDNKDVSVKETSSNTSRMKPERAEEPRKSLSRRDKRSHKGQDMKEAKNSREETNNQVEETIFEAQHKSESGVWSDDSSEMSGVEEEDEPSESHHEESSGITLFSLRNAGELSLRNQPAADLWSLKNFACYLTFDPNTANAELQLSDGNRRATRVWLDHRPSEHPERFVHCPQVLCREGLLDPVYWEVVWSGGADIGVTYNNISRDGDMDSCLLGHNKSSWSLECSEGCYTPCHNRRRFKSSSPEPFSRRVGVYLNWPAGSLSFYCVSPDAMVHLHTFTSTFTEPLYSGFWVWAYDGSVSLSQVELDWERLLQ